ncbi:helix-turn-helix transcriptional regulator [Salmonella enterica]|nr:helix-turn-helix transcriptional regulator [Salmonella enterica]EJP5183586.1 helix-turn-helix transcriptional regulator [Salmonella enterica]
MKMPAKPLTPEQKADADRLKAIVSKQHGLTQATLADELGFSNQSAVSQYLNGKIPLNIDAAIKFAERLCCSVSDFSPSIQEEINRISLFSIGYEKNSSSTQWDSYINASEEKQEVVNFILQNSSPEWADSDARAYVAALEVKALKWIIHCKSQSQQKKA